MTTEPTNRLNIGSHIENYREQIIFHIQRLLEIRSVAAEPKPGMPYGEGVHQALCYMLELARELGFATKMVDGYAGHAEYGEGDELAAVLVHLDTVEAGEGWTVPPFAGTLRDGKIFGRGATDDKGPAVIALFALKALKDLGIKPQRRLRVIFGTHEESGMQDLDYYFAREEMPDMAFSPDAGYPIFNVEMGNVNVVFRTSDQNEADTTNEDRKNPVDPLSFPLRLIDLNGGSSLSLVAEKCHATIQFAERTLAEKLVKELKQHRYFTATISEQDRLEIQASGVQQNDQDSQASPHAIVNMIEWLSELNDMLYLPPLVRFLLTHQVGRNLSGSHIGIARQDDVSGATNFFFKELQLQQTEHGWSGQAICNVRYPVTVDGQQLMQILRKEANQYGLDFSEQRHLYPVYVAPDHPVIIRLSRAYETITGEKATLLKMGAGTYARKLNNNGVAFGPGLVGSGPTNVHRADEYIIIEEAMKHGAICLQGMYELVL